MASSASVAITSSVAPAHAPAPTSESERLVFRQLYETLIEIDCLGNAVPGLARSWEATSDSASWLVYLRPDATFSDGMPVLASDVLADWRARNVAGGGESDLYEMAAVGEAAIRIHFYARPYDIVRLLSDRVRSVTRRAPNGEAWPVGTTGFQFRNRGTDFLLVESAQAGDPRLIRYTIAFGNDQRDALDDAVDMLVTDRPEVVAYSRDLGNYDTRILPWSKTYFLMLEGRQPALVTPLTTAESSFLEAMARDAITADARLYRPPPGWNNGACGPAMTLLTTPVAISRIGYAENDRTAREIAERLVFLASSGVGLPPGLSRLRENAIAIPHIASTTFIATPTARETIEIVPISSALIDPCRALRTANFGNWNNAIPLVDTRNHAIVRLGSPGILISGDGTPFFGTIR